MKNRNGSGRIMHILWTIAKREIIEMVSNKRILISIGMFLVIWGVVAGPKFVSFNMAASVPDYAVFYLSTVLSVYVVLLLSSQAFINEKREGRIEALLCTPVELKTFWMGKVLGVIIPGYGASLIVAVIVVVGSAVLHGGLVPVSPQILVYLLLVMPFVLSAFTGIIGFFQLFFGMKENRIFNMIAFIVIFGLLGAAGMLITPGGGLGWSPVGLVFAGALALNIVGFYLTRLLKKEKIITSME